MTGIALVVIEERTVRTLTLEYNKVKDNRIDNIIGLFSGTGIDVKFGLDMFDD